ncbi:cilia- and flagella-associated protein 206-like [Anthonomus grandis grandis]|uniref:cilia- and flagella-associated protein 206-like n=1 Tax=Anthonomus grandis grandis TaxID=2921223 RepID=UPI0021664E9A|nr:cilia- and flagella-associated protein 206-like [Anthonomus grandis grandis]
MADDENACVRNIVKEIMRECKSKKIQINKNFITYFTKLLLINPNWGIGDDFFSQRQNVQTFVSYITEELLNNADHPKLVTLKIQFSYTCNLEHMDYFIQGNRKELKWRLRSLEDDIVRMNNVEEKELVDSLYKKIVYYITFVTGLGNPAKSKVYEESMVALKSIFDEDEVRQFSTLTKHEKIEQLDHFSKVVGGIRLFNKDCDKGGEGIANLPALVTEANMIIKEGTEQILLFIMEKVNELTTIVDRSYVLWPVYHNFYRMRLANKDELTKLDLDIEHLKDFLIFYRQYELITRKVLEEFDRIYERIEVIKASMRKLMKIIHETVYMKLAIPVGVVFPLFEQLWEIWTQFQDLAHLLSRISVILSNTEACVRQMEYQQVAIDNIIGNVPPMTDAERLQRNSHVELSSDKEGVTVLKSESIKNIEFVKFEYLGFCCWKLVETNGALIPGNPMMGIVVYQGKNYVFSCPEGFHEFLKDPQMCINGVLDLVRKKPHLIGFFQLKEELESIYNITKLVETKEEIKMCEDRGIQTDSNQEEPHIDPKYMWNIWDLKRQALTLANISAAQTSSTQTNKTGSKNSVRTQTYYTKTVEVQTKKDSYTNVPRPSVFIYGLRGRKDDQQFKIDLTRPVEEK